MTLPATCSDCKYFDAAHSDPEPPTRGLCRRYAPRPNPTAQDTVADWPLVWGEDDWCGELVERTFDVDGEVMR